MCITSNEARSPAMEGVQVDRIALPGDSEGGTGTERHDPAAREAQPQAHQNQVSA